MTPSDFHTRFYGYNTDYDGVAGKQCVDLAKKHFEIAGYPNPREPIGGDGYADNIWYHKERYQNYYKTISPSQGFKDGDMVLFPHKKRGGWTHPYSHVCFWYNGKEFGMNQGGDRSACDKDTNWSDALGALRMKGWANMIESRYGHNDIKYDGPTTKGINIQWEHANASRGYRLYYIQAGKEPTSLDKIEKIDSSQLLITAKGGNNYFEMHKDKETPYGTHYGVEVDGRLDQYMQTREKNPNVIVFYEDRAGNCNVVTANEFHLEPSEVNFAVTPYAVRIHKGQLTYYRSSEYGDRDDYATNQSFWMKIGPDWCIGVAENCVPRDVAAFASDCGADELVLMDSGGSAQLLGWDWANNNRMNTYLKSNRDVSGTGVLATPIGSLIQSTVTTEPEDIPEPVEEEEPVEEPTPAVVDEEPVDPNQQTLAQKLGSRKLWAAIVPFLIGLFIKFGMKETLAAEIGSYILIIAPPLVYMFAEAWVDRARANGQSVDKVEDLANKIVDVIEKRSEDLE